MIGVVTTVLLAAVLAQEPSQASRGVEAVLRVGVGREVAVGLRFDADALLLGIAPASSPAARIRAMESIGDGETETARLREFLRRRVRLRFDGVPADLRVEFPARVSTEEGGLLSLGGRAVVSAVAPSGARTVSFFASRSFGPVLLHFEKGGAPARQQLEPGERSAAILLP